MARSPNRSMISWFPDNLPSGALSLSFKEELYGENKEIVRPEKVVGAQV